MATGSVRRHAGGRPTTVTTLTPFGQALTPLLRRLDWSIYDLAAKVGERPNTIWRWMKTAKKWPPTDKAEAIARAVGVRVIAPAVPRKSR
jgi:ribosome-binding protein aMBF1 (putative translation factor)